MAKFVGVVGAVHGAKCFHLTGAVVNFGMVARQEIYIERTKISIYNIHHAGKDFFMVGAMTVAIAPAGIAFAEVGFE